MSEAQETAPVNATKKTILLVDIENSPKVGKQIALEHLSQKDCVKIVIVFASNSVNFTLTEISSMTKHLNSGRLVIHRMTKAGKNSADFGLSFFAGEMAGKFKPNEVIFKVVSNDSDLDYLTSILSGRGYKVDRMINKAQPATPVAINKKTTPIALVDQNQKVS